MRKKIFHEFFCVPQNAKMTDKVFKVKIGFSVLTLIAVCAVFCSGTFAWFNSQQRSMVSPIIAAEYSLTIETDGTVVETKEYICPLATEDCHTFIITAGGTATTGYCEIKAGDQTYTTVAIPKGQSIRLIIVAAQGTQISFSPQWGTATSEPIAEKLEISQTSYQVYTAAEQVTLEQIAEYYKVPAEDILLYNGISEIAVGAILKIPNTTVSEPMAIPKKTVEESVELDNKEAEGNITESTETPVESVSKDEKEPVEDEIKPTTPEIL